jgi:ribosomal protein S14
MFARKGIAIMIPKHPLDEISNCRVCGNPHILWGKLCRKCIEQRDLVEEISRQKKRDLEFGNPWKKAGVRDEK